MPGVVVDDASAVVQVGVANAVAIGGFAARRRMPAERAMRHRRQAGLRRRAVADADGLPARHVLATVRGRLPGPGGGADAHLVAPASMPSRRGSRLPRLATRPRRPRHDARPDACSPSAPAWRRSAAASGCAGSSATRPGWRPCVVGLELVLAVAARLVPLGWACERGAGHPGRRRRRPAHRCGARATDARRDGAGPRRRTGPPRPGLLRARDRAALARAGAAQSRGCPTARSQPTVAATDAEPARDRDLRRLRPAPASRRAEPACARPTIAPSAPRLPRRPARPPPSSRCC